MREDTRAVVADVVWYVLRSNEKSVKFPTLKKTNNLFFTAMGAVCLLFLHVPHVLK